MIRYTKVALFPAIYLVLIVCSHVHQLRAEKIDLKVISIDAEYRCLSTGRRENMLNEFRQNIKSIVSTIITYSSTVSPTMATTPSTPDVTPMGISEAVFTCGGTPGWRRLAFINMTNTS